MTDAEMEELIQHTITMVGEQFIEMKRLYPQFLLVGKTILPIMSVGMEKEAFAAVIRYHAALMQPRGIISTCESWLVQGETLPPGMKPSQHPKAVEGLYVAVEDIRLGIRMYFGRTYNHGSRVSHDPIKELTGENGERATHWEGTYTGLLSPNNAN